MAYKETVRLVSADNVKTYESGFTMREFKGETLDEDYPQLLKFKLVKDKVNLIDGMRKGDIVDVEFFLNGREVEKKDGSGMFHILELTVKKLTPHGQTQQPGNRVYAQQQVPQQQVPRQPQSIQDNDEDLPF